MISCVLYCKIVGLIHYKHDVYQKRRSELLQLPDSSDSTNEQYDTLQSIYTALLFVLICSFDLLILSFCGIENKWVIFSSIHTLVQNVPTQMCHLLSFFSSLPLYHFKLISLFTKREWRLGPVMLVAVVFSNCQNVYLI